MVAGRIGALDTAAAELDAEGTGGGGAGTEGLQRQPCQGLTQNLLRMKTLTLVPSPQRVWRLAL